MYSISEQQVSHPAKVVWPTALFSYSEHLFMTFVLAIGQLTIWQCAKANYFMSLYILGHPNTDLK